jgi:hypothetical protein
MFGLPAAVFSSLLVATGIAKLRRPGDTAKALAAFGVPDHLYVGLSIGAIEIGVGLAALVTSAPPALLAQALLYSAFSAWIIVALVRRLPIASCGCLGTDDTPPYWGHLAVDICAVLFSLGAVITPSTPLWTGPMLAIAGSCLTIGVGSFLAWLVIGDAARLRVTYSK